MLNFWLRTMRTKSLIPPEGIERRIYLIRGHKVMLDTEYLMSLAARAKPCSQK